ncbi:hypothetical protein GGI25_004620 [Coemansia spiralis]|uniref:Uncharacterized protein n=2 Tax=Coemansia TaxID=4863 RepID=A0A9W8G4S8_9FUNG|nr:hypothetical protein BX070DRAFT_91649 [Coemansia spiralis]KAJ1989656.1 hypothetical protein EDC05_004545 [Coemansia umbellata]KAJ2620434.1 hypothetical protein GGI26_005004 [Coemansia sp. RSA 1358]KAJ2673635.1 hypothetical protein GGI25_004620 [Coemansia spiralis]
MSEGTSNANNDSNSSNIKGKKATEGELEPVGLNPIMQEYARKIVGENGEIPLDYTTMVIEARRRGRQGLPQPHLKPHRCDKHLQDFIDGIFLGEIWEPAKVYFRCVGSKLGEEPERYKLKGDPNSIVR